MSTWPNRSLRVITPLPPHAFDLISPLAALQGLAVGAWRRWRAARHQAAVRAALRQLSPHLLRDIGAPDDVLAEAAERELASRASMRSSLP